MGLSIEFSLQEIHDVLTRLFERRAEPDSCSTADWIRDPRLRWRVQETYGKVPVRRDVRKTRENIMNFLQRKLDRKSPIYVVLQNGHAQWRTLTRSRPYKKLWSIPGVDENPLQARRSADRWFRKIPGGEQKGQRRNPCHLLWRGPLYVRYDGLAYPCCYMYDEKPLGDLKKQSVMEVWNSPGMVQLREAHLTGDLSQYPICQTCQAHVPASRPCTAASC